MRPLTVLLLFMIAIGFNDCRKSEDVSTSTMHCKIDGANWEPADNNGRRMVIGATGAWFYMQFYDDDKYVSVGFNDPNVTSPAQFTSGTYALDCDGFSTNAQYGSGIYRVQQVYYYTDVSAPGTLTIAFDKNAHTASGSFSFRASSASGSHEITEGTFSMPWQY